MNSSLLLNFKNTNHTNQAGITQIATGPKGLTVNGEVKRFVPVTDAMPRNPDPADWLMIRRN